MRFYELAAKIGIEKKDIKHLQDYANEQGFDVKNSLATVDDKVISWAESNADDIAQRLQDAQGSKKSASAKKRSAVAKKPEPESKAEEPAVTEEKQATEISKTEEAPVKPAAVKEEPKQASAKPVAKQAPESPKQAPASKQKVAQPVKHKPVMVDTPSARAAAAAAANKKKAQKREQGRDIKINRPDPVRAPVGKATLEIDKNANVEDHHTGQKHKRADFKGTLSRPELPAIFSSMDTEYTRSIRAGGPRKRSGRGRGNSGPSGTRRKGGGRKQVQQQRDPNALAQLTIAMSLRDLSEALGVKLNNIMGFLMKNGQMVSVNDILGEEDIMQVAEEFQIPYEWKQEETLEQQLEKELEQDELASQQEESLTRPPVITFMGHVDHGKTSLLDKIRATRVAEGESGGITQHIGAYTIEKNGHMITFLDTPGHEAFTQMRARGADLTDVVVLVVAADDGVMPQTKEAFNHAKNANVPIIVAINKCDIAGANPDKVRQEMSNQLGLLPEEWGGNAGMIEVSAHTGQGLDLLLERILLESEMLELRANPDRKAVGFVIESEMTESRGVEATVLVQDGTLYRGDIILTSNGYGKVKLMYDWQGKSTDCGGPSQAVSVVGLSNVPEVGDRIYVVDDMVKARKIAEDREHNARAQALSRQKRSHVTLENLTSYLQDQKKQELNVIIKADVSGSLEVLQNTLADLATDEVSINVIHSGVGGISQADIILADASDALVLGFHVIADSSAKLQASSHGVQIKIYHIIYRLIEDMKAALVGMLPPEEKEVVRGSLEVREVFRSSKLGNIAGCYVTDGTVNRNCRVRLIRDSVVIYDGKLGSLKRFKDDVKEVRSGFECGARIDGYDDLREGDVMEAYEIEEVARTL